ncbi:MULTISPECIES: hypothetical protein [unclassified Paraburkholderia]|uniref:hypothetical protein n=1 Tax=unclassified Paraburkholderia TaxID=2615204 RepID=UPI002AB13CC5|nr:MULTISPECIES: hypothetical protein [unclassified Paraburkholderia]
MHGRNLRKPLHIGKSRHIVFVRQSLETRHHEHGVAPAPQRVPHPLALRAREVAAPRLARLVQLARIIRRTLLLRAI